MTPSLRRNGLCIVAAVGLITPSVLLAQASGATTTGGQNTAPAASSAQKQPLTEDDREFVEKAASSGLAEVQMGQLASKKATSPRVKEFGERMVKDHGTANSELQQIVSDAGVELPKQPAEKHKDTRKDLAELSGKEFDEEYMEQMVEAHEKDVEAFEDYAKDAKHTRLKAFAEKNLPILREHLQMAKEIEKTVKE